MNQTIQATFRLTKSLGVIVAVFALLLMSSGHLSLEECPQEVVTQEVELFLAQRDEQPESSSTKSEARFGVDHLLQSSQSPAVPVSLVKSERDGMNGLGTYLLI